jgi:hypothetical protein
MRIAQRLAQENRQTVPRAYDARVRACTRKSPTLFRCVTSAYGHDQDEPDRPYECQTTYDIFPSQDGNVVPSTRGVTCGLSPL